MQKLKLHWQILIAMALGICMGIVFQNLTSVAIGVGTIADPSHIFQLLWNVVLCAVMLGAIAQWRPFTREYMQLSWP